MNKKLWGGRFSTSTDTTMERFSESISFDKRLYEYDITGSIVHAQMLAKAGIITEEEANTIIEGLRKIKHMIDEGEFDFRIEDEDIHMNIERKLIEIVGKVGGKLHTARSRNDQIALDIRLFLRDATVEISDKLKKLLEEIVELAEKYIDVVMPGFTHLQHAQPVLFSHYLMAYYEKFKRDRERFLDTIKRIDVLPLGSGALAGTSFPIDRRFVAEKLKFSKISNNSMDAVSDRDFAIEYLNDVAICAMHASRFAEEMVIFSTSEFDFFELPDEFCTGSSIMPQKKNPDAMELVRGKTARTYGNLIQMLTLMKALPLTYNRDLQEDKESLFDSTDTIMGILDILIGFIPKIKPKSESLEKSLQKGYITATDVADYLAKKGLPFREAHRIVGEIVAYAEKQNKQLHQLSIDELKGFFELIESDIIDVLSYKKAVDSRTSYGGTARENVKNMIKKAKSELKQPDINDRVECPRCGYPVKIYKNPIPTVDIIIEVDNKIVLIRRKNEPFGWAIPGGYIDYGESAEDAAVREAKEETGLDVELKSLLGVYSKPDRDPRNHTITTVFVAKAEGTPKASDDALEIGLFDKDNLPQPIVFDHEDILKDYFSRL
ncbi:argininosuccinate lyase [Hippea jasoniae]|uniref:argininosuccinate lyase n=1 Tax=Hippea jasoniae TaxID=944479 RepID=UPI00068C6B89|nr:argininosuccinate lyase [Hippea jasoniae]